MNAGESLGNKSAACDGYADENPIVMTTPQYTVSNVLCQTVDTETPYDRGANHNETNMKGASGDQQQTTVDAPTPKIGCIHHKNA